MLRIAGRTMRPRCRPSFETPRKGAAPQDEVGICGLTTPRGVLHPHATRSPACRADHDPSFAVEVVTRVRAGVGEIPRTGRFYSSSTPGACRTINRPNAGAISLAGGSYQ